MTPREYFTDEPEEEGEKEPFLNSQLIKQIKGTFLATALICSQLANTPKEMFGMIELMMEDI